MSIWHLQNVENGDERIVVGSFNLKLCICLPEDLTGTRAGVRLRNCFTYYEEYQVIGILLGDLKYKTYTEQWPATTRCADAEATLSHHQSGSPTRLLTQPPRCHCPEMTWNLHRSNNAYVYHHLFNLVFLNLIVNIWWVQDRKKMELNLRNHIHTRLD